MKIGVLAVQGAFIEHEQMIWKSGHDTVEIRQKKDLNGIDGLILPGGESTVQGQLLKRLDMFDEIKSMITDGLPTLGTWAGLILLAQKIEQDTVVHLGTLPVTVKRNAYGRQLASFITTENITGIGEFPMTFIRAPYIVCANDDVDILATVDGKAVAAKWHNQIGLAFHPEMSDDTRIHEYFLTLCEAYKHKK